MLENETKKAAVNDLNDAKDNQPKKCQSSEPVSFESLPDFLTHNELCQYLRIGHNRAYELAQRIDFPKIPFGNWYVFPKQQVKEWMEQQLETRITSLQRKLDKVRKAGNC